MIKLKGDHALSIRDEELAGQHGVRWELYHNGNLKVSGWSWTETKAKRLAVEYIERNKLHRMTRRSFADTAIRPRFKGPREGGI